MEVKKTTKALRKFGIKIKTNTSQRLATKAIGDNMVPNLSFLKTTFYLP
jgi:hypothetical protein